MGAAVFIYYIIPDAEYHAKQTRKAINSDELLHYFQHAVENPEDPSISQRLQFGG
jgi:hypothetical protein